MQLSDLNPAEIAFLSRPARCDAPSAFAARLTRGLAAALSARLRTAVALASVEAQPGGIALAPRWQVDAGLASLWLARRLGGRTADGSSPFVPGGLLNMLDDVLAERWLDAPDQPPGTLAWRVQSQGCDAVLRLDLPQAPQDMTRWALGRISQ